MSNHRWVPLFAVMLIACSAAVAEPKPDEVLAGKGLVKDGNLYLLAADAALPEALRQLRATEARYQENAQRRKILDGDIRSIKSRLGKLGPQIDEEKARLRGMDKGGWASYNRQVGIVNQLVDEYNRTLKELDQRIGTRDRLPDYTDEYAAALQTQTVAMESIAKAYASLSADGDVTAALAGVNRNAKAPARLGPSESFKQEFTKVRNLRDRFVASTIHFGMAGGVPVVPVVINGLVEIPMVLDSGAGMVFLSHETAKKLGLRAEPGDEVIESRVADGRLVKATVKTLKSVRLGAFTIPDVECAISGPGEKDSPDLLGSSFLRNFVYKVDLDAKTIHLTQLPGDAKAIAAPGAAAKEVDTVTIEALIDGRSELHITPRGIYWMALGVAKPGRHGGRNEPTFVNGAKWFPKWRMPGEERGHDSTETYPLAIETLNFEVDVLAITAAKGGKGIEKRDAVTIRRSNDEQVVSIPDEQNGSRWYSFRLVRRPEMMRQPGDQPLVEIVSARFGGGKNWADVTDRIKVLVAEGSDIWVNPGTLKADPTPGWRKQLHIVFKREGERKEMWVHEEAKVDMFLLR